MIGATIAMISATTVPSEQPYFRRSDVIEPTDAVDDSGLVETPESAQPHGTARSR